MMGTSQEEASAEGHSMVTSATFLRDTYPCEKNTGLGGARGRSTTEADDRKWEPGSRICCSTTSQATAANGWATAAPSDVAWQAQAQNALCGDEFSW